MSLPIGTKIPLFAEGNATENDVLEGKTFSNEKGNNFKGVIPNMGSKEVEPKNHIQELGKGYYSKIKIKGINELDQNSCENIINSIKDKFPNLGGKKYASGNKTIKYPYTLSVSNLNFTPTIVIIVTSHGTSEATYFSVKTPLLDLTPRSYKDDQTNGSLTINDNGFQCTNLFNLNVPKRNIICDWVAIE